MQNIGCVGNESNFSYKSQIRVFVFVITNKSLQRLRYYVIFLKIS